MAFLFPKNGLYYIIDKSRKPSWIRLGKLSYTEAKAVLRRYETDSNYLRLDLPLPPSSITFKELVDEYMENIRGIKAPYTVDREKHALDHFCITFGKKKIHEITGDEIEKYLVFKEYKPRSWRNILVCLRSVYKLAVARKYLPENPAVKVRLPKIGRSIPRFVDPALLDQVIECMQGPIKAYYMILRYTGMRPGEALKLKVKNIREITYTDKKTKKHIMKPIFLFKAPKTNSERAVPIHPALIETIKKITKGKKLEDYLFPARDDDGHQKSMKGGLKRVIANREKAIEKKKSKGPSFKGVSMYTFRHTVATDMLAKTGDLRAVQTVLGHSSSATTEIYAHALEAAKVMAIDSL